MPTFTHQLRFGYYPVAVHVYPTVMYFFEKVFGVYPNVGRLGLAKIFEVAFGSALPGVGLLELRVGHELGACWRSCRIVRVDLVDLVLEGGPLVFELFHFLVGGGLLEFLEAADAIVEVVMLGHERVEGLVRDAQALEFLVEFRKFVVDIVVF